MQHPPFLKAGDTIGITCPSGYVAPERVAYAVTILERWGFRVRVGKTVGSAHFYFSGTDEERLADLQQMLDDPDISAVLMGRGGYGMSRLIDRLDLSAFSNRPKWVCGFSDITLLHNHIQARLGIPTLHSPMCGAFTPETETSEFLLSLRRALTGETMSYQIAPVAENRAGTGTGILTGGNLALLAHATGTASAVNTTGKILFIEDIGEHLYQIDRMLVQLKRAGHLEHLAGLLVGDFSDVEDTERPFGQNLEQIIRGQVEGYGYPVCFGFPAGHTSVNFTLCLGAPHRLTVSESGCRLELTAFS